MYSRALSINPCFSKYASNSWSLSTEHPLSVVRTYVTNTDTRRHSSTSAPVRWNGHLFFGKAKPRTLIQGLQQAADGRRMEGSKVAKRLVLTEIAPVPQPGRFCFSLPKLSPRISSLLSSFVGIKRVEETCNQPGVETRVQTQRSGGASTR